MKDAILQLAEQQLMVGGFDKLNFATLAKELGTTRANIHYHFKNKESLAIEVTRQYGARYCDEFKALREMFRGNFVGFFETVNNYFWPQTDDPCDQETNACTTLASDPELPESIVKLTRESYRNIEQIIADVIQDGIDNKEVRSDIDAKKEATRCHVIMMGIGACGQHLSSSDEAKEQLGGILVDWANSLK